MKVSKLYSARSNLAVISLLLLLSACAAADGTQSAPQIDPNAPQVDRAAQITHVDVATSYVRIAPEGFVVYRPFPKIFFSDKKIQINNFINEQNVVVGSDDLRKIFNITSNQPCNNALVGEPGSKRIEITGRVDGGVELKCAISQPDGCAYLANLLSIGRTFSGSYDWSELKILSRRIDCPQ